MAPPVENKKSAANLSCTLLNQNLLESGSEFALEAGVFPRAIPQEIQTGAAHLGLAVHYDLLDQWRAGQESALNADAIAGYPPDGEVSLIGAPVLADDHTFELLGADSVTFFDLDEYAHIIASLKLRYIGVDGCLHGL